MAVYLAFESGERPLYFVVGIGHPYALCLLVSEEVWEIKLNTMYSGAQLTMSVTAFA